MTNIWAPRRFFDPFLHFLEELVTVCDYIRILRALPALIHRLR